MPITRLGQGIQHYYEEVDYLAEGSDTLEENEKDDDPAEEQTQNQLPAHFSQLVYTV